MHSFGAVFHVNVDVPSLNASCKNIYQLGKDLSEFGRSNTALWWSLIKGNLKVKSSYSLFYTLGLRWCVLESYTFAHLACCLQRPLFETLNWACSSNASMICWVVSESSITFVSKKEYIWRFEPLYIKSSETFAKLTLRWDCFCQVLKVENELQSSALLYCVLLILLVLFFAPDAVNKINQTSIEQLIKFFF